VIAKFWGGPIWNTWNEIAENAALAHHTNLETTARLFAALNLSFADSTIAFYDAKYYYQIWRPITAIRLADTDGNPATIGDSTWTPLAVTAADPSYPGAHSTISAAERPCCPPSSGIRIKSVPPPTSCQGSLGPLPAITTWRQKPV